MGITDAIAVSAGTNHSCALHQNGTISCWGYNWDGELGNGQNYEDFSESFPRELAPVRVTGITDATAISAGGNHSCALHQTGTISCWGANWNGRLGDGTNDDSSVPVGVTGITDATAISAGGNHSCALHQTGTISCWGENGEGQLGDGNSGWGDDVFSSYEPVFSSVPVGVVGITDATAITTGVRHSCALHQTGTISCWGNNRYGELGNGQSEGFREDNSADSSVPVSVASITDATAITTSSGGSFGGQHSCALHRTGAISCWGNNSTGQLGDGNSGEIAGNDMMEAFSSLPVRVTGFGG